MIIRASITIILLLFSILLDAHCASFDCTKATGKTEKIICSDEDISILDEKLSKLYNHCLAISNHVEKLRLAQRHWLRNDRNLCSDSNCVIKAYENRIIQLEKDKFVSESRNEYERNIAMEDRQKNINGNCLLLFSPLDLVGEESRKMVCKGEIKSLLELPIKPVNQHDQLVIINSDGSNHEIITNCSQYLSKVGYGHAVFSRMQQVIEEPFMRTCGALVSLANSQYGSDKFKTIEQAFSQDHVPPEFLINCATTDYCQELSSAEAEGKTALDLISEGDTSHLDFLMELIVIADVDGDGINDYVVGRTYNSSTGSDSYYTVGYLSPEKSRKASKWVQFDSSNINMEKVNKRAQ